MSMHKVWLPTIKTGSGADVYSQILADALGKVNIESEISWFRHGYELCPWMLSDVTPPPAAAIDVEIETEPGVIIGCRFHIHDPASPNIIFFHGNGEIVADYDDIGPLYNHAGMNLLVTDFRGYGWSSGNPTVSSMLADAEVLSIAHRAFKVLGFDTETKPSFKKGRQNRISLLQLSTNFHALFFDIGLQDAMVTISPS